MFHHHETLEERLTQKEITAMSALTDAMNAVVAAIKSNTTTVDPKHIASIDAALSADTADIADIKAALNVLSTGLVPAPATLPAVTSISPTSGSVNGGETITITGTGFTAASVVPFGSVAASSFTVVNDTTINAVSPAQAAGTYDVTVVTPAGTSATSAADQYTLA